jgi:Zn-dependent M28 family amino/carboxypeptidase
MNPPVKQSNDEVHVESSQREHELAHLERLLDESEVEMCVRLRSDVEMLAEVIGERNTSRPGGLEAAAKFIEDRLAKLQYEVKRQEYRVGSHVVRNIEVEIPGDNRADEILILGAHYDSIDCPAANDNASGVAGVLEAARAWSPVDGAGTRFNRTVRLVFFVNEEPPFYKGELMGSVRYARRCRAKGEKVRLINLETIGCYYGDQGSQRYPQMNNGILRMGLKMMPKRGNFVVFTGDLKSWRLALGVCRQFKRKTGFPAVWFAAPKSVEGPGMSDNWSFWQEGYRAIMVTDTAFLRYPYYHTPLDLPDKMNFACMTRVVGGVIGAVEALAG